jgi:Spy/CpxP family protein refolding chaperone
MNRIRRITLATLVGGLAAGAGFQAFAHRGARAHGPMDIERMLKHFYVEIDATEAQKQRLDPIVKQAARDLQPLHESFHAGRREALELLTGDRVDPAALEAFRAKQLQLADEASRRLTRAIAEAAEVLTPAQRKDLAAHLARRHGRWHG